MIQVLGIAYGLEFLLCVQLGMKEETMETILGDQASTTAQPLGFLAPQNNT